MCHLCDINCGISRSVHVQDVEVAHYQAPFCDYIVLMKQLGRKDNFMTLLQLTGLLACSPMRGHHSRIAVWMPSSRQPDLLLTTMKGFMLKVGILHFSPVIKV